MDSCNLLDFEPTADCSTEREATENVTRTKSRPLLLHSNSCKPCYN